MEDVIPEILIDSVPATTSSSGNELTLDNFSPTTETPTVNEPILWSILWQPPKVHVTPLGYIRLTLGDNKNNYRNN